VGTDGRLWAHHCHGRTGGVSGLEVPREVSEALTRPPAVMMRGWTRSEVSSVATVGDDDELIRNVTSASRCYR